MLNARHNQRILEDLMQGDIISWHSGDRNHFAVYYGNKQIIHFIEYSASESNVSAVTSSVTVKPKKKKISRRRLSEVVGANKVLNANMDDFCSPLLPSEIVKRALKNTETAKKKFKSCRQFALWCRYGTKKIAEKTPMVHQNELSKNLEKGDMIEIKSLSRYTFGIYIGHGMIVHSEPAPPSKKGGILERLYEKWFNNRVCLDKIEDLNGTEIVKNKSDFNNSEIKSEEHILDTALLDIGNRTRYDNFDFAINCRYELKESYFLKLLGMPPCFIYDLGKKYLIYVTIVTIIILVAFFIEKVAKRKLLLVTTKYTYLFLSFFTLGKVVHHLAKDYFLFSLFFVFCILVPYIKIVYKQRKFKELYM